MKLIMENWRHYVEDAQYNDCGNLYIIENKKIETFSFNEKLNILTESSEDIDLFLNQWERSADFILAQNVLNEGVMDLVSQAAAVLGKLGTKSWDTVVSVTNKVLNFIEKFKKENPKTYMAIKWAIIAILAVAALYLIANATGMTSVTSAMTSLAKFQWPDVTISELVADLAGQGTVDALRALRTGLFDRVGEITADLIHNDNQVISDLGQRIMDMLPDQAQLQASDSFWEQAMEQAAQGM